VIWWYLVPSSDQRRDYQVLFQLKWKNWFIFLSSMNLHVLTFILACLVWLNKLLSITCTKAAPGIAMAFGLAFSHPLIITVICVLGTGPPCRWLRPFHWNNCIEFEIILKYKSGRLQVTFYVVAYSKVKICHEWLIKWNNSLS